MGDFEGAGEEKLFKKDILLSEVANFRIFSGRKKVFLGRLP